MHFTSSLLEAALPLPKSNHHLDNIISMGSGLECASPYDVRRGCRGSGGVGCVVSVRWRSCDVAPPAPATGPQARQAGVRSTGFLKFAEFWFCSRPPKAPLLQLSCLLSLSLVSCVGWPSRMGSIITDESPSSSDGAWLSQKQQQQQQHCVF